MACAQVGRLALVMAGSLALAACEPGQEFNPFGSGQSQTVTDASSPVSPDTAIEQDVESPDVFQATDAGLWDGRPSLGGVWIAHPDVVEPERVSIQNQDNGKSVVGALFRRERENPGPRFQVSSDAASELGMLAGSPSNLSVVALRRVNVPVVTEPAIAEPTVPVAVPDVAVPADIAPAIETTPIKPVDPIASIAASAIEAATENNPAASLPAADTAAKVALEATAAAVPTPRPTPAVPPPAALTKPFIQIGIFSVKSNAEDTSSLLRSAGVIPTIKTSQKDGKSYWRVVIGPIDNTTDRATLIKKVRGLGFSDAYAVTH